MKLPRNAQIWLPGLVASSFRTRSPVTHVWLAITDHYEPYWKGADDATARGRVATWTDLWPRIAGRHRDSHGRHPRYSFFYPAEDYRPEPIEALAHLVRDGIADVEVHLHHDGEGEEHFRDVVGGFVRALRRDHGLLREVDGRPVFGFIHGNWALDNSHPTGRHCGLNNEITLLRELGCYADFTLPSAPSGCQTPTVNSIYWADDDRERPRSHDRGERVRAGGGIRDALLMVQGPLTVRRHQRRPWAPSLEVGELTHIDLPTPHRVKRWLAAAPQVGGHQFIKLHTHGAQDHIARALLGGGLDALFSMLGAECSRRGITLGFATAWECAGVIDALARGEDPMKRVAS